MGALTESSMKNCYLNEKGERVEEGSLHKWRTFLRIHQDPPLVQLKSNRAIV